MMDENIMDLVVALRENLGKGSSRRLRKENKVPAILYGGEGKPLPLLVEHHHFEKKLKLSNFQSQIFSIKIGNEDEKVMIKALQRHPFKPQITHIDLQRVTDNGRVRLQVPLKLVESAMSPGVKQQGGMMVQRVRNIDIDCLPSKIPESIEVNTIGLHLGESIYLADVVPPEGVQFKALAHGLNPPLATVFSTRTSQQKRNED